MAMQMRPYQIDAVKAILSKWEDADRVLLVLPTGTGKTVTFSHVIADRCAQGGRILVLAHREELLEQAADKLYSVTGLKAAFERGDLTAVGSGAQVVVASVQTMSRENRLNNYCESHFNTIIVDEAHHCLADSYRTILNYFGTAKVLGVTATPDRADKKQLSEVFQTTAYEYSMLQAVKDGYLVQPKALMKPLNIDLTKVKIQGGDFEAGALGSAIEPYLESIADEMAGVCKNRKTVVFLPLVEMSQHFRDLLNERGFRAQEVNGNSKDRGQILQDFEQGRYNVLCNSMLLIEGWDCPAVDCIVVLRPTTSRALYVQMIGRGMRLSPATGKTDLLILDFLWMTAKHNLCRPSVLVSKSEKVASKIDKMTEDNEVSLTEAQEIAERDVLTERQNALAEQLRAQRSKKAKLVDPLQFAFSISDGTLAEYQPVSDWEAEPPTTRQLEMIERRGVSSQAIKCKGEASLLIDILNKRIAEGLSSAKQIRKLESYGFKNVGMWSMAQASSMMGIIAGNNWRVPRYINPLNYQPA